MNGAASQGDASSPAEQGQVTQGRSAVEQPTVQSPRPILAPAELRAVRKKLDECEAVIASAETIFVEVGNALHEINEGRLYSARYSTFENYVVLRWGFCPATCLSAHRRRARRLLGRVHHGSHEQAGNSARRW